MNIDVSYVPASAALLTMDNPSALPRDLWLTVSSHLLVEDVLALSECNKDWCRVISRDEDAWQSWYRARWPVMTSPQVRADSEGRA